jgi:hypothetical protein
VACWSRADLINRSFAWFKLFPRALRPEFAETCWALTEKRRSLQEWRAADEPSAGVRLLGQQMLQELTAGSGVAFLTGIIPPGAYVPDEFLTWAYRRIGRQIGEPIGDDGGLLVLGGRRRCSRPATAGRGVGGETTFHTDSVDGIVPDVVGMLCLAPATVGGEWQVSSGVRAHEVLRRRSGDILARLYAPFTRETSSLPRRGEPIFTREALGWRLRFQYMRYGIENAHRVLGPPLSPAQTEALDRLDEILTESGAAVQFRLKRGEMIFVNNRLVAHNRRPYIDHPDPRHSRKMVRMWLSLDEDWDQWDAGITRAV